MTIVTGSLYWVTLWLLASPVTVSSSMLFLENVKVAWMSVADALGALLADGLADAFVAGAGPVSLYTFPAWVNVPVSG